MATARRTRSAGEGQGSFEDTMAPDASEAPRSRRREEAASRSADLEAELCVVAALLTTPECFFDVSEVLVPEDFSDARLAEVYRAVLACDNAGRPFDQVTVADELKRAKQLARVGGKEVLERIIERGTPLITNVAAHAELVAELALKRRVAIAGRAIAAEALAPEMDGRNALDLAEERVFELSKGRDRSAMAPMAEIVPSMMKTLAEGRKSLLLGHSTGFAELDKLTAGLKAGQLFILGARPGMGKSALALALARHIAAATGLMVPLFSYEMTKLELSLRLLSASLGISSAELRRGNLPSGADRDAAIAAEQIATLPIFIDDRPPPTIGGVRSALRRLSRRGEIGAVVIDYLQLMDSDRRSRDPNRVQEVSEISKSAKKIAVDLGVPIIALSQLSRALEGRADKRPILSDLRESGSLEQDADVVMFLFREAVYNQAADPNLTELIVAKQRDGALGTVHLHFQPEATRFTDWAGPVPQTAHQVGARPAGDGGSRWGGDRSPF